MVSTQSPAPASLVGVINGVEGRIYSNVTDLLKQGDAQGVPGNAGLEQIIRGLFQQELKEKPEYADLLEQAQAAALEPSNLEAYLKAITDYGETSPSRGTLQRAKKVYERIGTCVVIGGIFPVVFGGGYISLSLGAVSFVIGIALASSSRLNAPLRYITELDAHLQEARSNYIGIMIKDATNGTSQLPS